MGWKWQFVASPILADSSLPVKMTLLSRVHCSTLQWI